MLGGLTSVAFQVVRAKVLNKRIPIRVNLNVTDRCNLRCKYCYIEFDKVRKDEEASTETLKDLIDQLHPQGTRAICFMGGEPLIRDDIGEVIDYAKKKGIICELLTNGYFLLRRIDELKNLDVLCISIDGDKESTDICRGEGCYDKAIEAIEAALKYNFNVRLHMTLSRYSYNALDSMVELSNKYSVPFIAVEVLLKEHMEKVPDMILTTEETRNFYIRLKKLKNEGVLVSHSIKELDNVINWPFGDRFVVNRNDKMPPHYKPFECFLGHRFCYIDSNGDMYACTARWGDGLNIFKDGFDKAWDYLEKSQKCIACRQTKELSLALDLQPDIISEIAKFKARSLLKRLKNVLK